MNEVTMLIIGLILGGIILYLVYKRFYEWRIQKVLHGGQVRLRLPEMRNVIRVYLIMSVAVAAMLVMMKQMRSIVPVLWKKAVRAYLAKRRSARGSRHTTRRMKGRSRCARTEMTLILT